jgi:hypothetical protein
MSTIEQLIEIYKREGISPVQAVKMAHELELARLKGK